MTPAPKKLVNPWAVAIAVSLATFMEVLDTTITNVSLNHIAGSLAASQDESTWIITSYLIANAIVLPLSGWLSDVLGRKKFFMICLASFTAASFACGAATSLPMLIVFRLVQGLAGGGLQPVQQAILLDAFPPEQRGKVFAVSGITLIIAPVIGPTLGGFITDNFDWRWIFYMNLPVGVLALTLVNRLVSDPPHSMAQGWGKIDFVGLCLIAVGLGSLQIVFDKGQQDDWFDSDFIVTMTIVAAVTLTSAAFWLLRQRDAIVNLRLLKIPSYGLSTILIFFTGFVLYGSSTILPLLVQSQFGYNATLAGLVLSPGAIAVIFLMPIAGQLVSRVDVKYLVMAGLLLSAYGQWVTSQFTPQTDYHAFVYMRLMQVLGLPFLFIPVSTMAFRNLPKEDSNKASALFALFRNFGGSAGIALAVTLLSRGAQTHQSDLSAHLSRFEQPYQGALAQQVQRATDAGVSHSMAFQQAQGGFARELYHQAAILAYRDTFFIMAVIMAGLVLIAFILPKGKGAGKAPAGH